MYQRLMPVAGGTAGTATLAHTGTSNPLWLILAFFALIAVGAAVLRIVPSRRRNSDDQPLP